MHTPGPAPAPGLAPVPVAVPVAVPVGGTAQRPSWAALPGFVRAGLEQRLGAAVVDSVDQRSGFTPGFAARIRLADGRRYFVKAADRAVAWMAQAYAREVEVLAVLPAGVPAPRTRFRLDLTDATDDTDDTDTADWLVVVFDDVSGHPPRRPWTMDEAVVTLAAVERTAQALTPAPPPPAGPPWSTLATDVLAEAPELLDRSPDSVVPDDLLGRVRELLPVVPQALAGDTLVHADLRDDNVILADDGRVWICDWNWPTLGPAWADACCLAVAMVGDGLDPSRLFGAAPTLAAADPDAVDCLLATLLLYFCVSAARPAVAGSPHLRRHQRWYADVLAGWLRHRLAQRRPNPLR